MTLTIGTAPLGSVPAGAFNFDTQPPEHVLPVEPTPRKVKGLVGFVWDAMDAWFEEDEEVFVHARDPYHRIDVLRSSRHVVVGGQDGDREERDVVWSYPEPMHDAEAVADLLCCYDGPLELTADGGPR